MDTRHKLTAVDVLRVARFALGCARGLCADSC